MLKRKKLPKLRDQAIVRLVSAIPNARSLVLREVDEFYIDRNRGRGLAIAGHPGRSHSSGGVMVRSNGPFHGFHWTSPLMILANMHAAPGMSGSPVSLGSSLQGNQIVGILRGGQDGTNPIRAGVTMVQRPLINAVISAS